MREIDKAESPVAVTCQADLPRGWDDFVMECEPSHFEQTSWWAGVESEDGWNARYVVGREADRIVAGAMVLVRRQNRIGRVGYVFRGPLIRSNLQAPERARTALAAALKQFSRDERLVVLVVVPAYDGEGLANTLLDRGFLKHPTSLPPRSLPPGTITIDLRRGSAEIERGYRSSIRNQINRAARKGLKVELGTAQDLEVFWLRHQDLCRRRGVVSNVPGLDYARRVWHEFHQHGRAWMFNAMLDGEVLCSLICLGAGKWFYLWRIGWAPASAKIYPTQAVYARAIRTAKEAGYHFFDLMEIHPDDVARIERGEELNTPTSGVTFFKLGFGGEIRNLPPTLDWLPNPFLRLFMRAAGRRLFSKG